LLIEMSFSQVKCFSAASKASQSSLTLPSWIIAQTCKDNEVQEKREFLSYIYSRIKSSTWRWYISDSSQWT
jgi:hypothetical protein